MSAAETFLIETQIHGKTLKTLWDTSKPFPIGQPFLWAIERTDSGVRIRYLNVDQGKVSTRGVVELTQEDLESGKSIELPGIDIGTGKVTIKTARSVQPAFQNHQHITPGVTSGMWCLYECIDHWVVGAALLESEAEYVGDSGKESMLFKLSKQAGCVEVKVVGSGLVIVHGDGTTQQLNSRQQFRIPDSDLDKIILRKDNRFWRFNKVTHRKQVDVLEQAPFPTGEAIFFKKSVSWTVGAMVAVLLLLQVMPMPKKEEVAKEETIQIYMPPPKKAAEPTPEPPKPTEAPKAKVEKPKPEPKKAAPPPPAPAPKKAAPPPPPPAPRQNFKAPPPPPVQQKPVEQPKTPPPPPPPTAEQIKAQQAEVAKAKLSSALNFLSSTTKIAPSKVATSNYVNPNAYQAKTTTSAIQGATALNQIASGSNLPSSAISTKSARVIGSGAFSASEVGAPGGKGKALNQVFAKVRFGSGDGAGLGGGIGDGSGTEIGGQGQLSQAELEKALSKYLDRFQYCYEKALLSNSNLGGSVVMKWDISTAGAPSNTQVAKSQMNDEGLHSCMKKELMKIKFPQPRGGPVSVKYQFNFTKTAL